MGRIPRGDNHDTNMEDLGCRREDKNNEEAHDRRNVPNPLGFRRLMPFEWSAPAAIMGSLSRLG